MRQEDKAAPPETSPLWGGWEHRVPQRKTGARLSPSAPHRPPGGSQTPELALSTPPPPIAAPTYPCSGRPGRSRAGAGAAGQGVPTSLRAETGLSTGHTGMLPPSPGTVPPQHPPNPGTVPVSRPPARHRSGSPSRDWGGGGVSPAGVSPAPLRGGRTGGSQPVHGAAAFGAAALYGAARGGGGRERRDSPGAALGPAPGPGSAAGSRPPPAPAPACPTSRLSPASHVPRATPPPPRSYVPRAVPHSPACAPLPHSGDSPPG